MEDRLRRLRERLAEKELDTFMVSIAENRRYLSGFTGEDTQFDESAGVLFITADRLLLATDSRFDLQANREAPLYTVFCYSRGLVHSFPDVLARLGTKRLGFEAARLSWDLHAGLAEAASKYDRDVQLVPTRGIVEALRVVKSPEEIASTREALRIAENAFLSMRGEIRPGMTEKEVAWMLERRLREAGADSLSFPVIVASGPNSALPHAIPSERRLKAGEPVLLDWGARYDGYCSDISRTLFIAPLDDIFEDVYRTVAEAQQKAVEAVRPGVSGRAVDAVARRIIDEAGYAGRFGHGLGHGTGLAIHESPRLGPVKEDPLEQGMVFTVEPGIYIEGWGGVRLENMVAVGENGAEVLNGLGLEDHVITP